MNILSHDASYIVKQRNACTIKNISKYWFFGSNKFLTYLMNVEEQTLKE